MTEIKDGNTEKYMDALLNRLDNRVKRNHSPEDTTTKKFEDAKKQILQVLNETLSTDDQPEPSLKNMRYKLNTKSRSQIPDLAIKDDLSLKR